jgi:Hint domain
MATAPLLPTGCGRSLPLFAAARVNPVAGSVAFLLTLEQAGLTLGRVGRVPIAVPGSGENTMSFSITSFYIVPPQDSIGNGPIYTLLVTQTGDVFTGTIGMSGPLGAEPPIYPPEGEGSAFLILGEPNSVDRVLLNSTPSADSVTMAPYSVDVAFASLPVTLALEGDLPPAGADYIVRLTLTITNPDRTEPPPLISAASKEALAAITEQLDTLSRGFDMLNSANPFAAGLKTANWGVSNAVSALSPQVGLANSVQQAVLSVEDTAVATIEGNPVAVVLGLVSTIYSLTGVVTGALARDPPDGNYTTVFQPTNDSVTIAGETAVDSALIGDSIDYLDDTLSMLIASERFQGASLAGDTGSATLQTNAYNAAQAASLTDAAAMSSDLTAFQAELATDGYTDVAIGDGSLASEQSELASTGTSDAFLTNLIADTTGLMGAAGAQSLATQVIAAIDAETAQSVSGTVFGGIGSASTDLTSYANGTLQCFLRGTLIRTVSGDVPVERLAQGDRVVAIGRGDAPAIWIGHRRVDARRHPDPRAMWPVRIAAGTFGEGQPFRDLFLSPDHAVFVMDMMVPIKYLIDGVSIAAVPMAEAVYYHVELPRHEAIFANGLATESYLETGGRARFDNADVIVRLFPDVARPPNAMMWEVSGRAPLVVVGSRLAAVRAFLAARAAERARSVEAELHATRRIGRSSR